jgi:hypothetical protein
MTRYLLHPDTASAFPITAMATNCNPVTRIGALSEGEAKKAALGRCITSRVNSGESNPAKRLTSSNWSRNTGHTPDLDAASWMPIQIHRDKCHGSFRVTIRTTLSRWGRAVGPALNKSHLINVFQERQRVTVARPHVPCIVALTGCNCACNLHKPEE